MTPEQWQRVGVLFHEALDLPLEQRISWARTACAADPEVQQELLSLLENDRSAADGFVEGKVLSAVASMFDPPSSLQRVGPYRLVRELGRGGMGTVYLAERDDQHYRNQVAVKVVRPGMDTEIIFHRFRRERQTLARLDHPHVARLLDGGTAEDGRPYIVMEYIDGVSITSYCKERGLGISDRLWLFLNVCSAVEYAHRQFVVHRDIKPGNILVSSSGMAKLLDFGICKLLRHEPQAAVTASGTLHMLTPDYASPEQVQGDPVTVASDIYSLAAVLYELLTGAKPHRIGKLTPQAVERAICEEPVIRPSLAASDKATARRLQGDLDNVLLLALNKEPARRYASVQEFSDDIRRYLAYEPVKARPDTLFYRAGKFARRRRNPLVVGGLVAAVLVVGSAVSLREARRAKANLLEARSLANAFLFDVHDAVRDLPGSTRARQLIVETGLRYLDGLSRNASRDSALQLEIARAYQRIGDIQGAEGLESYRKAMTLLDSILQREPADREAQVARSTLLQRIGKVQTDMQETGKGSR